MTFGLSTLKRIITKRSGKARFVTAELIAAWALFLFLVLPPLVFRFSVNAVEDEYRERVELLLPFSVLFAALLLSVASRSVRFRRVFSPSLYSVGTALLVAALVANVLSRPPARIDYLWYGFGRRVLALSFLVGIGWSILQRARVPKRLHKPVRVSMIILLIVLYLPDLLQPSWGIINLGDASHQVIEEVSGPLVGHFPGINFVSTYTTLLGVPLMILRPFPLSHALEMTCVLVWVNALVIAVPALLVVTGRRAGAFRSWAVGSMFILPPLLASGKWGAAASNVESLSMIPGRTLLPVGLGLLLIRLLPRLNKQSFAFVGALSVAVAFNNVEFGAPAAFAAAICAVFVVSGRASYRKLLWASLFGVICAIGALTIVSFAVKGRYDVWFRVGSYAGKPYSPAEVFPIWSAHNLLLSIFATGIVLGVFSLRSCVHSSLCAIYFGIWGLVAFPYCSYRCLEGMYMATQVYFIPAIGATLGIVGCLRASADSIENSARVRVPVLAAVLGCFAIGCAIQAPNPRDEWIRVLGRVESAPWAEDSRRGLPSEWSTSRIDWLEVQPILEARDQIDDDSVGYFGYMGNSVQLATGLNNLSRINSSEVLQIKGTEKLVELACREVDEVRPRYIILVGMDLPCQGYQVSDRFLTTRGVQVLMRIDS